MIGSKEVVRLDLAILIMSGRVKMRRQWLKLLQLLCGQIIIQRHFWTWRRQNHRSVITTRKQELMCDFTMCLRIQLKLNKVRRFIFIFFFQYSSFTWTPRMIDSSEKRSPVIYFFAAKSNSEVSQILKWSYYDFFFCISSDPVLEHLVR